MLDRPSGAPVTTVCDCTHPDSIREILAGLRPRRTWLVVATKSGTTAETRALAAVCRRWISEGGGDPDAQSLAVTDAGSPLTEVAADWRAIITTPADVGGRFSALSAYGLLLPTLAGVDTLPVIEGALSNLEALTRGDVEVVEPALAMAARLAPAARESMPLRVETDAATLDALPGWLEQLLAESLGKGGAGLIPVVAGSGRVHGSNSLRAAFAFGDDSPDPLLRQFPQANAAAELGSAAHGGLARALGAELLTWELVTSLVGWCLGVSPFDQPDVERSKRAARRALAGESEELEAPPLLRPAADDVWSVPGLETSVRAWLAAARSCDYVTVQLFAPPARALADAVDGLCIELAAACRCTVTWGYGPRYLHSTGQLHKGGPPVAVLQLLVPPASDDLEVPGEEFGLWQLLAAQATGDAAALSTLDRPLLRFAIDGGVDRAVRALRSMHLGEPFD